MAPDAHPPSPEALLAERGWLRALARRLVGDPSAAEDVVQETWITAVTRPPREGSALRPWLRKVLSNHALQWRRKESGRARRERAAARREGLPSHEEMYDRMDAQRVLVEEVLALPEPFRGTLSLRFFEELDPGEIARLQGVEPATVRSRLKRGLDQLRVRLDGRYGGERQAWLSALAPFAFGPGAPPLDVASDPAPDPSPGPSPGPSPDPGAEPGALAQAATAARGALPEVIQGALTMNLVAKLSLAAGVALVAALGVSRLTAEDPASRDELEPARPAAAGAPAPSPAPPPAPPARSDAVQEERVAVPAEPPPSTPAAAAAEPTEETAAAPSPAEIRARFVDESGHPVPGAVFETWRQSRLVRSAPSDAEGDASLSLDVLGVPSYVALVYHAPGFARGRVEALALAGETTPLGDLVLAPGGTVHGYVVDPYGRPVADARVWFNAAELSDRGMEVLRRRGLTADFTLSSDGSELAVRSDAEGRFALDGAPAGAFRLWATAKGMRYTWSEPLELAEGGVLSEVELVLEPLREKDRITGVVLDPDGEPASRARIKFYFSTPSLSMNNTTTVGADGRFELVVWDDVPYDVTAEDAEGEWAEDTLLDVLPGTHDLVLRLAEPRELVLRVHDAQDEPVETFQARAFQREGSLDVQSGGRLSPLVPPEPGRARLTVPRREFHVAVEAAGFAPRELGPFDPERLPEVLDVELVRTAAVRGVVLAGGEPLAGARVALYALADAGYAMYCDGAPSLLRCGPEDRASSGEDGTFTLALVEDGRYVVRAEADGYAATESEVFALYAQTGLEDLVLELDRGGALLVSVARADGQDATGAIVRVSRGDGRPRTGRADDEGRLRFELLTPGPWNVELVDEELDPSSRVSVTSSLPEGEEWTVPYVCEVHRGGTTRHDLVVPE